MYKLKKNINIIKNQLKCKLLVKNVYSLNLFKSIRVNINLNKLTSFYIRRFIFIRIFNFFKNLNKLL